MSVSILQSSGGTLAGETDVKLTSPTNGQALIYQSSTKKWVNGSAGSTSPLTTKGDIWAYSTTDARKAVGTDGYALVADSTQATGLNYAAIGTAQPNTTVQLDYNPSTDIANGVACTSNTWTDICSNQSFTVDNSTSVVEISVCGATLCTSGANTTNWASRVVIDSGGTPINKLVNGDVIQTASSYCNPINGALIDITGLTVGSHTIKVQVYSNGSAGTAYCRPSTNPNTEFLSVRVLERKIVSTPSPISWTTKTSNYTIVTTDRAILVDTSGGAVTITLPTAVSATQLYTIKKKTSDANAVTIATTASQTIDGSSTQTLSTQNQSIDVASDNANWYIL